MAGTVIAAAMDDSIMRRLKNNTTKLYGLVDQLKSTAGPGNPCSET